MANIQKEIDFPKRPHREEQLPRFPRIIYKPKTPLTRSQAHLLLLIENFNNTGQWLKY